MSFREFPFLFSLWERQKALHIMAEERRKQAVYDSISMNLNKINTCFEQMTEENQSLKARIAELEADKDRLLAEKAIWEANREVKRKRGE